MNIDVGIIIDVTFSIISFIYSMQYKVGMSKKHKFITKLSPSYQFYSV